MIHQMLENLKLPPLLSRDQMLQILQKEEYGFVPAPPTTLEFEIQKDFIPDFCAGKAQCNKIIAHGTINNRSFSFPFYSVFPTEEGQHPFFVHINFRDDIPDKYMPTEELVDHGFAVLSLCYTDVTSDNGDFSNGIADALTSGSQSQSDTSGKIAMWAWAIQRVMDYAQTRSDILDLVTAVVCGHSRLGKTALLAAATDPRFAFAYSNDSGCSGAAITRGKRGERVRDIFTRFPYWFCKNYGKYADHESDMPFDQHYLVAAIAPRHVLIGSASEDVWADPIAEQLCCHAASPAFEKEFCGPSSLSEPRQAFLEGDIAYHQRPGLHYFGREDWLRLIDFVGKHSNNPFIK